jgi:hypothetical protein
MRTYALAMYVVLAGCTVDEATDTTGAVEEPDEDPMPDRTLNLQLSVVDEMGRQPELNRFAQTTDVFLSVRAADPTKPVVVEEFAFDVTDKNGTVVSSDEPRCRRFRVDERGDVASMPEMCLHKVERTEDGKMLIGVAPFYDAMKMTLTITAVDDESLSVPFAVGG